MFLLVFERLKIQYNSIFLVIFEKKEEIMFDHQQKNIILVRFEITLQNKGKCFLKNENKYITTRRNMGLPFPNTPLFYNP